MRMTDIAELIENGTRALAEEEPEDKQQAGVGFPTGLSLNHCAAHYTPNVCLPFLLLIRWLMISLVQPGDKKGLFAIICVYLLF